VYKLVGVCACVVCVIYTTYKYVYRVIFLSRVTTQFIPPTFRGAFKRCGVGLMCHRTAPPSKPSEPAATVPSAHTPGCVLHILYYVYYVVLNITWTYSSPNDLTYHAVGCSLNVLGIVAAQIVLLTVVCRMFSLIRVVVSCCCYSGSRWCRCRCTTDCSTIGAHQLQRCGVGLLCTYPRCAFKTVNFAVTRVV
jgi:hypothetical protein